MRYGDDNASVTKVSWAKLAWNLGFSFTEAVQSGGSSDHTNTVAQKLK